MEYYPAVDMEMRIERTSNFITMVLGYIVVNLLYQSTAVIGFNAYSHCQQQAHLKVSGKGIFGVDARLGAKLDVL